jgi:hypothetical protein
MSSIDADVDRATVLSVLRFHGVDACQDTHNPTPDSFKLSRGPVVFSMTLSSWVPKRVLRNLERKFNIYLHHFFQPSLIDSRVSRASPHLN